MTDTHPAPKTDSDHYDAPEPDQRRDTAEALREFADRLGVILADAPTPKQQAKAKKARKKASAAAVSDRPQRFRRWLLLTAVSASLGYALHLVQVLAALPYPVAIASALLGAVLDQHLRGWGRVRVSQVRGFVPVLLLVVVRVPLASALAAILHLTPIHH